MKNILKNKIDYVAYALVTDANPGGDPNNDNLPRTDNRGYGEITDVCTKRKMRNRLQDMENPIFVQSVDRCDDDAPTLKARADKVLGNIKDDKEYKRVACEQWCDIRSFGNVFAFGGAAKGSGVSRGVRGPVTVCLAKSVAPVIIDSLTITKSVNGQDDSGKKGNDTMGAKHIVRHGLYKICGSISPFLAQKTGFTEDDAEAILESLRTLFVNDASAARPDGSMEIVKVYWFKHNCPMGQYSASKTHKFTQAVVKEGVDIPNSLDDYDFVCTAPDDIEYQVVDGF